MINHVCTGVLRSCGLDMGGMGWVMLVIHYTLLCGSSHRVRWRCISDSRLLVVV